MFILTASYSIASLVASYNFLQYLQLLIAFYNLSQLFITSCHFLLLTIYVVVKLQNMNKILRISLIDIVVCILIWKQSVIENSLVLKYIDLSTHNKHESTKNLKKRRAYLTRPDKWVIRFGFGLGQFELGHVAGQLTFQIGRAFFRVNFRSTDFWSNKLVRKNKKLFLEIQARVWFGSVQLVFGVHFQVSLFRMPGRVCAQVVQLGF